MNLLQRSQVNVVCLPVTAVWSRPWVANTLLWWGHQSALREHPQFKGQIRNICLLNDVQSQATLRYIRSWWNHSVFWPNTRWFHFVLYLSVNVGNDWEPDGFNPVLSTISHREEQPFPKGCIATNPVGANTGHIGQDCVLFYPVSKQLCCLSSCDSFQQKTRSQGHTHCSRCI